MLSYGVDVEKKELEGTIKMRDSMKDRGVTGGRARTKGTFQVVIPDNGHLNRVDTAWANKANPAAHAAQVHRDKQDLKMLAKKKQSRELSNNLWQAKAAAKKPNALNLQEQSQSNKDGSALKKSARSSKSTKSVNFSTKQ